MHYRYARLALIVCVFAFSSVLMSNPDVIFCNSSDYNGAFLKHELKDGKIKFLFSAEVDGFTLPDEYFSVPSTSRFMNSTMRNASCSISKLR